MVEVETNSMGIIVLTIVNYVLYIISRIVMCLQVYELRRQCCMHTFGEKSAVLPTRFSIADWAIVAYWRLIIGLSIGRLFGFWAVSVIFQYNQNSNYENQKPPQKMTVGFGILFRNLVGFWVTKN